MPSCTDRQVMKAACQRRKHESDMRRIILLGYMGSGKTTMGKALSDAVGLSFYDLDWYIETRMRTTVAKIFAEKGEEKFRTIERNMLHEVAEFENVIISCGGGTPCFFDNMEYLNGQGDTVYLKATADVLHNHLLMTRVERPLLAGKTEDERRCFIAEQLRQRETFYCKAHHIFEVQLLDTKQRIKTAVEELREKLRI